MTAPERITQEVIHDFVISVSGSAQVEAKRHLEWMSICRELWEGMKPETISGGESATEY